MSIFKKINDKETKTNMETRILINKDHTEVVGSTSDILTLFSLLSSQLSTMVPRTLLKSAFVIGLEEFKEDKDCKNVKGKTKTKISVLDSDDTDNLKDLLAQLFKDM